MKRVPIIKRFEASFIPEPNSGCWLWIAGIDKDGYGLFKTVNQKTVRAHRASWLLYRGRFPKDLWVLHTCDTPSCVNPDHLFLGTAKSNAEDCSAKRRWSDRSGANNNNAKLTDETVRTIRADQRAVVEIAASHNVSQTTVRRVRDYSGWRHVVQQEG